MRRAVTILATLAALTALPTAPASADWAHPKTAAAVAALVSCPDSLALRYHYYSASGVETTSAGSYSVRVAVDVRDPDHCSGLIDQADGAARGYDDGNPAVGNVQVDGVSLWTNSNPAYRRAGPSGLSNSNGNPTTALIYTPYICVSPLGTGSYHSQVHLTWRNNGVLVEKYATSWGTSYNYNTVAC